MRLTVLFITVIFPALTACTPSRCEVDGVRHRIGETYDCGGCNKCTCELIGVSTTSMKCFDDPRDSEDTADTSATAE
jgi:hypothetical protein